MNAFKVDLALCLAVMLVLAVVVTADEAPDRPLTVWAYLWPVALGLLMLVRRDHPLLVLALTTLGFFTYYAAGFPAIGVGVPIAAALFSAAEMGPRARRRLDRDGDHRGRDGLPSRGRAGPDVRPRLRPAVERLADRSHHRRWLG